MHRELTDDRLTGSGGCRDEDRVAAVKRKARLFLEIIEIEVVVGAEGVQRCRCV